MARSIARGARCERDGDNLAALAGDHQSPVPALDAQGLDVGTGSFGHAQPVERQQGDQRMLGGLTEPGGNEQRTQLVAVQPGGYRLIIQPGTADMRGQGLIQQVFLHRVPVEPGDGAQPPGDRGPGATTGLQVAGETLDVRTAGLKQAQVMLLAPARVLTQVQLVRFAGQAAIAGQESSQRQPLRVAEHWCSRDKGSGRGRGGHWAPPGSG